MIAFIDERGTESTPPQQDAASRAVRGGVCDGAVSSNFQFLRYGHLLMIVAAPAHSSFLLSIPRACCSLALSACIWIGIAFSTVSAAQAEPSDSRPAIIHPWIAAEPANRDQFSPSKPAPSAFMREIRAGDAARKAGGYTNAIDHFSKALALAGTNDLSSAIALTRRGTAFAIAGNAAEALRDHERAIDLSKRHPLAYYGRGRTFLELKRYEDALQDYDTFLQMVPSDAEGYLGKGAALKNLGRLQEARAAYDKALEIAPKNTRVIAYRASILCESGKHAQAISDYTRILETKPDADTLYARGNCFQRQGDYLLAIGDYDSAIRQIGTSKEGLAYDRRRLVSVHVNRGNAYRALKKYDEALADYERAQQLNPKGFNIYSSRGWLYQLQGRRDLARGEYLRGLKLAPNDVWLNKALKHLDAKGR